MNDNLYLPIFLFGVGCFGMAFLAVWEFINQINKK